MRTTQPPITISRAFPVGRVRSRLSLQPLKRARKSSGPIAGTGDREKSRRFLVTFRWRQPQRPRPAWHPRGRWGRERERYEQAGL